MKLLNRHGHLVSAIGLDDDGGLWAYHCGGKWTDPSIQGTGPKHWGWPHTPLS